MQYSGYYRLAMLGRWKAASTNSAGSFFGEIEIFPIIPETINDN